MLLCPRQRLDALFGRPADLEAVEGGGGWLQRLAFTF